MPRGGARPGAGRKKKAESAASLPADRAPSLNVEAEKKLADYAAQFTAEAVDGLVKLARHRKTPAGARVMAWKEVLDRGHGRPPQAVTGPGGGPLELAWQQ